MVFKMVIDVCVSCGINSLYYVESAVPIFFFFLVTLYVVVVVSSGVYAMNINSVPVCDCRHNAEIKYHCVMNLCLKDPCFHVDGILVVRFQLHPNLSSITMSC